MDNDDILRGRLLSRREALILLGGAGLAALAGCGGGGSTGPSASTTSTATTSTTSTSSGTCVVRPELTEGPYFVDERLNRSDIRSDPATGAVKQGVLLNLAFNVSRIAGACTALAGAMVDVWHADALGIYSDITTEGTIGQQFLRGYQLTNSSGAAAFTTIYPGWYRGRAVHIHFKIRTTIAGVAHEFTAQLFFDDALTDQIYTQSPYSTHGTRDTRNNADGIYRGGGSQLLLSPTKTGQDYATVLNIGLQY